VRHTVLELPAMMRKEARGGITEKSFGGAAAPAPALQEGLGVPMLDVMAVVLVVEHALTRRQES